MKYDCTRFWELQTHNMIVSRPVIGINLFDPLHTSIYTYIHTHTHVHSDNYIIHKSIKHTPTSAFLLKGGFSDLFMGSVCLIF